MKGKGNERQTSEKDYEDDVDEDEAMDKLQASIGGIHAEIKATRADMKMQLNNFHDTLSRDIKRDSTIFREDVNRFRRNCHIFERDGG